MPARPSEVRYRLVGYDGVTRWIRAKTKPSHVDGRVFVDGIVSDVTVEVAREHELAEAQAGSPRARRDATRIRPSTMR